jgi:hypothetical protein
MGQLPDVLARNQRPPPNDHERAGSVIRAEASACATYLLAVGALHMNGRELA